MKRALLAAVMASMLVVVWGGAAGAQESEHGIGFPPDWDDWDVNGNWQLDPGELEALTNDDWIAFHDWAQEKLEDNGGDFSDREMRDWIRAHADSSDAEKVNTRKELGIAKEGSFGGDSGDDVRSDPLGSATGAVTERVQETAQNAATSAVAEVANAVGAAAGDLVGRVGEALSRGGAPTQLTSDWYQAHYQRMLGWAGLLMLPLAMLAIGLAVVRGQSAQVGETLLQVPVAYMLGVVAVSVIVAASGLAQAMTTTLAADVRGSSQEIGADIGTLLVVDAAVSTDPVNPDASLSHGPGLVLLLGLAVAFAALVTLVWLVLAEAAVYGVVLFAPLAFAGRVWPQTAHWGRKLLTFALALVASKVVIFALWALALAGLSDASGDSVAGIAGEGTDGQMSVWNVLAVLALLMLTAFSPLAVLRVVPMVEGAQAAGDPGAVISRGRELGQSTARTATTVVGAVGSGSGGRLPVSNGRSSGPSSSTTASPAGGGKPPVDTTMAGAAGKAANKAQTAATGSGEGGRSGPSSAQSPPATTGGGGQVPPADPPGTGSGKPRGPKT